MDLFDPGMERLMDGLAEAGSGDLSIPGMDEPTSAPQFFRLVLLGARERGWTFDQAYAAAINRLQPSQIGPVDLEQAATLSEERTLIKECEGLWRSAFEQRAPTSFERAQAVVAGQRRTEGILGLAEKKAA